MERKTVGQNEVEMRDLAVQIMQDNYRAADNAAKNGMLPVAKAHLQSAEVWRQKARQHGANV